MTVFRPVKNKEPLYLSQHLDTLHPFPTRLAAGGGIRLDGNHGELVNKSFLIRAAKEFNTIPSSIRMSRSLPSFKQQLKLWIKTNISPD